MLQLNAEKRLWRGGVSFVRSKFNALRLRKKTGVGILGALALVAVPTAAFAVHSITTSSDTHASETNSVSASTTDSTPAQEESADNQLLSQQNNTSNQQQTTTSVTVNGESIPVPTNGEVHKTITDDKGNTTVDISVDNNSSNTSNTSSNVQINSNSSSFSHSFSNHTSFSSP